MQAELAAAKELGCHNCAEKSRADALAAELHLSKLTGGKLAEQVTDLRAQNEKAKSLIAAMTRIAQEAQAGRVVAEAALASEREKVRVMQEGLAEVLEWIKNADVALPSGIYSKVKALSTGAGKTI